MQRDEGCRGPATTATHANRVLSAIRSVNRLVVRERDARRLIGQACETLVVERGYHGVWIGLSGPDGRCMAWAEAGWGKAFDAFALKLNKGEWPLCRNTADTTPCFLAVIEPETTCAACSLSDQHTSRRAIVAMLRHGERTLGMLGIAFPNSIAVDVDERALVAEVAGDLGFALASIETEARRSKIEQEKEAAATELRERSRLLAESNRLMMELAALPSHGDIRHFIARGLRRVTGAAAASFSEFDPDRRVLRACGIDMDAGLVQKAVALLGQRIEGIESPVTDEAYAEIVGKVVGFRKTLTEVSFGAIPPVAGAAAQLLLGADRFIALAHVIEGRLFGTSMVAMRRTQSDPPTEWLESIAHMVAVTMRRCVAEEALQKREKEYRRLAENASDVIWVLDLDVGRFSFVSPSVERLRGYTVDEVLAQDARASVSRASWKRLTRLLPERLASFERAGGAFFRDEVEQTRKDGTTVWTEVSSRFVRNETTGHTEVHGVSRDITDRRAVEESLRLKDLVFERSIAANSIADLSGVITEVNETFLKLWGYASRSDAIGRPIADFFQEPVAAASALASLNGTGRWERDFTARRKDGTTFIAHGLAATLTDDQGRLVGYQSSIIDVTVQRQAEETLRLSEAQHRRVLEQLPVAVVVHSPDTRITFANERACAFLGLTMDQMAGRSSVDPAWRFVREDGTPMPAAEFPVNRVTSTRKEVSGLTVGVDRPSTGDRAWGQVEAFPELAGSELRQVIVTFVDITERRHAEHERTKLQAGLAQSDRLASMGILAAGVAHEINNPLSYVLYNLESLSDDVQRRAAQAARIRAALDAEHGETRLRELLGADIELLDAKVFADVQERFSDALSGSRRIKDIARGLGVFSRIDAETLAPVDLRFPIESAVNIASNEIKYRARVAKEFGATSPVLASEGRLGQVFLNLLVNAAHSISEGHVERNLISIKTWQEGADVVAEIRDTGCGISPENLGRLFDPFFTTKAVGVGTGLGLSIVKSIVTGYGGSIDVSSEVGRGSRFLVRLPVARNDAAGADDSPASEAREEGCKGRVLVIDDERGIRVALKRILRRHEVVEAESGEAARDLLSKDQRFDVILCDIMMPMMSGVDLHMWLLEQQPELASKLVFVTGGAFTPTARAYLERVSNVRVDKPFDATNLQKMVSIWVAASKARG